MWFLFQNDIVEGLFALLHQQLTICKEVCGYLEINILYGLLCQLSVSYTHLTLPTKRIV